MVAHGQSGGQLVFPHGRQDQQVVGRDRRSGLQRHLADAESGHALTAGGIQIRDAHRGRCRVDVVGVHDGQNIADDDQQFVLAGPRGRRKLTGLRRPSAAHRADLLPVDVDRRFVEHVGDVQAVVQLGRIPRQRERAAKVKPVRPRIQGLDPILPRCEGDLSRLPVQFRRGWNRRNERDGRRYLPRALQRERSPLAGQGRGKLHAALLLGLQRTGPGKILRHARKEMDGIGRRPAQHRRLPSPVCRAQQDGRGAGGEGLLPSPACRARQAGRGAGGEGSLRMCLDRVPPGIGDDGEGNLPRHPLVRRQGQGGAVFTDALPEVGFHFRPIRHRQRHRQGIADAAGGQSMDAVRRFLQISGRRQILYLAEAVGRSSAEGRVQVQTQGRVATEPGGPVVLGDPAMAAGRFAGIKRQPRDTHTADRFGQDGDLVARPKVGGFARLGLGEIDARRDLHRIGNGGQLPQPAVQIQAQRAEAVLRRLGPGFPRLVPHAGIVAAGLQAGKLPVRAVVVRIANQAVLAADEGRGHPRCRTIVLEFEIGVVGQQRHQLRSVPGQGIGGSGGKRAQQLHSFGGIVRCRRQLGGRRQVVHGGFRGDHEV